MHSKLRRVPVFPCTYLIAAAVCVTAILSPAAAAVRRCHDSQSSEVVTAPKQFDAKKKALEQWRAKALTFGPGFDSWRLAHLRALTCFKKEAGFECVAVGQPCIVDQTPATPLTPATKKVPSI